MFYCTDSKEQQQQHRERERKKKKKSQTVFVFLSRFNEPGRNHRFGALVFRWKNFYNNLLSGDWCVIVRLAAADENLSRPLQIFHKMKSVKDKSQQTKINLANQLTAFAK